MIGLGELDRLLAECEATSGCLSQGERRVLERVLKLRKRHGGSVFKYLSCDDLELLEDWSAPHALVTIEENTVSSTPKARHSDDIMFPGPLENARKIA